MALPNNINDKEFNKFVDAGNSLTAVKTEGAISSTTVLPNKVTSGLITWAAATTGAIATHPLFTVTGVVALTVFAVVGTDATSGGAATISVGTALSTAGLLPNVAYSVLDASEIWHDATPDTSIELDSVLTKKIVVQTINVYIAGATITGGTITFYCSWYPVSSDGNVVAVSPFA
jgi:hypothetical protein